MLDDCTGQGESPSHHHAVINCLLNPSHTGDMGSQQGLVHQLIIRSAGSRPQPWPSPDEYPSSPHADLRLQPAAFPQIVTLTSIAVGQFMAGIGDSSHWRR